MTDRPMDRDPLAETGRDPAEPHAGAANTPPFEHEPEQGGGRPPSHREHAGGETRMEDRMEGIAPAPDATGRGERTFDRASERLGNATDRASETASRGAEAAANRLDAAADRVHERVGEHTDAEGIRGRAARWADDAADAGEDAADFLRDAGVDDLRALVERQVRERPIQTLLLAAATGWIVGKILR